MNDLFQLTNKIIEFRDARDWKQFHTPKNLAAALAIEAAELQEVMLWKRDGEVRDLLSGEGRERLEEEIGDVLIFALLLAQEMGIDPRDAIHRKLEKNATKYPVELSKGRSEKYTALPDQSRP